MANFAWLLNAVAGAPSNTGRTVRQAMSVALGGATAARPLGATSGVRPGTPASTVALPTATSYVIHPHAGVLDTQASASAGPYWYAIPADETGTVNAAHATWPRKDILWVRIDDPGETDGSSVPAIVTGYTAGTAAAFPAVPATPARAMRLATISVPLSGGGAPTIVFDAPDLTAAGGGVLARFKGIVASGQAVTAGVYWPFTLTGFSVAEDNLAGYNASTSRWVAPTAGTYLVTAQIRTSASVPNQYIGIAVNNAYVATSVHFAGMVGGGGQYVGYLRLAAGDGVSMAAALTYTAANGITPGANFLQIVQVAF